MNFVASVLRSGGGPRPRMGVTPPRTAVLLASIAAAFSGCADGVEPSRWSDTSRGTAPIAVHVPSDIKFAPNSVVAFQLRGSPVVYQRVDWIFDSGLRRGYCISGDLRGRAMGANCYEDRQIVNSNAMQVTEAAGGKYEVVGLVPRSATRVVLASAKRSVAVRARNGIFSHLADFRPRTYRRSDST